MKRPRDEELSKEYLTFDENFTGFFSFSLLFSQPSDSFFHIFLKYLASSIDSDCNDLSMDNLSRSLKKAICLSAEGKRLHWLFQSMNSLENRPNAESICQKYLSISFVDVVKLTRMVFASDNIINYFQLYVNIISFLKNDLFIFIIIYIVKGII